MLKEHLSGSLSKTEKPLPVEEIAEIDSFAKFSEYDLTNQSINDTVYSTATWCDYIEYLLIESI